MLKARARLVSSDDLLTVPVITGLTKAPPTTISERPTITGPRVENAPRVP